MNTSPLDLSPFIAREAARLNIGAKADVRPEHYTFQRTQKLYTPPLTKTKAIESLFTTFVTAILGVVGVASLFFLMAVAGSCIHGGAL